MTMHDSTDSIIEAVKHLFGVSRQYGGYEPGVSLEDADGLAFIPSHENFEDGMTVYVRIQESYGRHPYNLRQSQGMSNGTSRSSAYPTSRSVSPHSRGRRSTSATAILMSGGHGRSLKRAALYQDADIDHDWSENQWSYTLPQQSYLPEDEEEMRAKAASVASADISVENIVEGGRRKRPKFSSDVRLYRYTVLGAHSNVLPRNSLFSLLLRCQSTAARCLLSARPIRFPSWRPRTRTAILAFRTLPLPPMPETTLRTAQTAIRRRTARRLSYPHRRRQSRRAYPTRMSRSS